MANEITYSVALSASKGGAVLNSGTLSDTVTMSGSYVQTVTQAIGTGAVEALSFNTTDLTGDVWIVIKNLATDPAHYVEVYRENAGTNLLSKLYAGESCLLSRVPGYTGGTNYLHLKAFSASCNIQAWLVQV